MNNLNPDEICKIVAQWMRIKEENGQNYTPIDVEHSALLRRLLVGLPAHEKAPPKRYGYPCWDLVEKDEVEIQTMFELETSLCIDQHIGYQWADKENKIISYPRLSLFFQYYERETIPDKKYCSTKYKDCPEKLKYTGKFLKRIKEL